MDVQDFSSTTILMVVLLPLLSVFAILGNSIILGIVARFKKFRTFPNILIANLALIDSLNALVNIPMYLLSGVLEVKWFKGSHLAIVSLFLFFLFMILNLVSMLVLLVNVFLAIKLNMRYFTWKTNEKALAIVLGEWLVCLTAVALMSWSVSDIDLQDAPVSRYRQVFLDELKFVGQSGGSFLIASFVFGALVFCAIQKKKQQVRQRHQRRSFFLKFQIDFRNESSHLRFCGSNL